MSVAICPDHQDVPANSVLKISIKTIQLFVTHIDAHDAPSDGQG